ncbi:MAG: hypothetical protein RL497_1665 [Pseudomonadota bacterium]|jgi:enamine deaminase RidA (YjgF/YER057c/UK114 family)
MQIKKWHVFIVLLVNLSGCAAHRVSDEIVRKHYGSFEADIGYSQVVRVGKTLYISGVVSTAPTFVQQLNENYRFITKILNDYGVGTEAIVKETIYTRDMALLKQAIPERRAFFKTDRYPSSSWVQVSQMFDPANLVEVEVEAHIP